MKTKTITIISKVPSGKLYDYDLPVKAVMKAIYPTLLKIRMKMHSCPSSVIISADDFLDFIKEIYIKKHHGT